MCVETSLGPMTSRQWPSPVVEAALSSVVFTATDDCGNSSNSVATFTLIDTTAPTFNEALPADETVQWRCGANRSNFDWQPTSAARLRRSATLRRVRHGSCTNSYTIQRTWTASDACDNEVSHVQTLSVIDTTGSVGSRSRCDCPVGRSGKCY